MNKNNLYLKWLTLLTASFCSVTPAVGQTSAPQLTLKELSYQAFDYSLKTQIQNETTPYYQKGEWPTSIKAKLLPVLLGVGRLTEDPEATPFTTAVVINILAQAYLDNPEDQNSDVFKQIPAAVQNGINTFKFYQDDDVFNFYPKRDNHGVSVRRPIKMRLLPPWYGPTNIPNDADTTSVVYTALTFNSILNPASDFLVPNSVFEKFSTYRDVNRKPMFYNKRYKTENTGAFMTWLMDENDPHMPRFYFASSKEGPRIPLDHNDVDCVVNVNILKLLALAQANKGTNLTDIPGQNESCALLNDMITKDQHATCGVYYPNVLNLSYAIAAAEKAGLSCISENSHHLILQKILKMQKTNGSWLNEKNVWPDPVITTAFALYALLQYGDPTDANVKNSLVQGAQFLLSQAITEENGQSHWPANGFFTGGAIGHGLIIWKSEAYTNAIIGTDLLKISKLYPDQ